MRDGGERGTAAALAVLLGGGIGALLRVDAVALLGGVGLGTGEVGVGLLLANLVGAAVLGLVVGRGRPVGVLGLGVRVGVLGGLTSFSGLVAEGVGAGAIGLVWIAVVLGAGVAVAFPAGRSAEDPRCAGADADVPGFPAGRATEDPGSAGVEADVPGFPAGRSAEHPGGAGGGTAGRGVVVAAGLAWLGLALVAVLVPLVGGVALAGGVGALGRWALVRLNRPGWPWGTLAANLLGCGALGAFLAVDAPGAVRLVLGGGLLGGLTTFSTLAVELRGLGRGRALAYATASVLGGAALLRLGGLALG